MNEEEKRTKIVRILRDEACEMCVCSSGNDYSAAYLDAEVDTDHVKEVAMEIFNVFAKGEDGEEDQMKEVASDFFNQLAEQKRESFKTSEEQVRSVEEIEDEIERMQNVVKHMNAVPIAHESGSLNYMFGKISGMYFAIGKRANARGEVIEEK